MSKWTLTVMWDMQSAYLETPWGLLSIAGPVNRPLFSERYRRGIRVLPIGFGWRIRWRQW